ncbi:MAG: hypothetical protein WCJ09_18495 [Planctomycetota bacterium]
MPLNAGGLAVPLEQAVVSTHWLTPPIFCHVQVAIPDEPDVVEEPVVLDSVVLEPVVLDSVVLELVLVVLVLEVLDVLLLVLVVVGTLNSLLAELRSNVAFDSSMAHAMASTHRVFAAIEMSDVEYGNVGLRNTSTTNVPAGSSYGVSLKTGSEMVPSVVEYHLIHNIAGGFPSTLTLNVPGIEPGST